MDVRGDLKIAVRGLRRQAGLAFTILFTLALGIGATTAVFSVVNAVVLAPLPYAEPEKLVRVYSAFPAMKLDRFAALPPEFLELTEGAEVVLRAGGLDHGRRERGRRHEPGAGADRVHLRAAPVPPGRAPGSRPPLRRCRHPSRCPARGVAGARPVDARLRGDPRIVGRSVRIDGVPTEVVGVMPKGFAFPTPVTELWLPLTIDPANRTARSSHFLSLVGRLRPGGHARPGPGRAQDLHGRPRPGPRRASTASTGRAISCSPSTCATTWWATPAARCSCSWGPRASSCSSPAPTWPACCWPARAPASATWPCRPRSGPAAAAWCGSFSPRACSSPSWAAASGCWSPGSPSAPSSPWIPTACPGPRRWP